MAVDLTEFEHGRPFAGDYMLSLGALQARLARAQLVQLKLNRRMVLVFEGLEGSGKTDILKLFTSTQDPRLYRTVTVEPGLRNDDVGHWLAPFWATLPPSGRSTLFFHSWYSRTLEDKVLGLVGDKEWTRSFDEINEFEAQQRDNGTLLIKIYCHVTEQTRMRRLEGRQDEPLLEPIAGPVAMRERSARTSYDEALRQMLDHNDTRWSPWTVVDANEMSSARIAALSAIATAMEKEFPMPKNEQAADILPMPGGREGRPG